MRKGIFWTGFLFAIPALIALFHDIYLAWFADPAVLKQIKTLSSENLELDIPWGNAFQFSDLGYVWMLYSDDSLHALHEMLGEGFFSTALDFVLKLPGVGVGLIIAFVAYGLLALRWKAGKWPFDDMKAPRGEDAKKFGDDPLNRTGKSSHYKYKRR